MYDMEDFENMADGAARQYLVCRASDVWSEKREVLERKYGLTDEEAPKTAQEVVDRIKAGRFVFKDNTIKDDPNWYGRYFEPTRYLRWRSPDVKEDKAGFEAAMAKLQAKYAHLKDSIYVDSPTVAKSNLHEFESATFH
jgi:hypothetical protein